MWTDTWAKKQGHPYSQEGGHRTTPHTTTSRVEAGSPHTPPWPLKVAVACWLSSGHCVVVLSPSDTRAGLRGQHLSQSHTWAVAGPSAELQTNEVASCRIFLQAGKGLSA